MKVVLAMNISSVAVSENVNEIRAAENKGIETSEVETKVSSKLAQVLHRPLIIGASVSGDYLTASPGKRLALRYTSAEQIKVIALKGYPGREILKSVNESTLKDRTAVIAMDLFFWDSVKGSVPESLKALQKLIDLAAKNKIPLVIGEIPEFSPQFQPHAEILNKRIHELCKNSSECRILPLNHLLRQALMDGYIIQGGIKYSIQSLLPDGLHIAAPASDYLADKISELLSS